MADVQSILSRLKKVKGSGHGKWSALCPAHADKQPSLSVGLGDDGKVLLHCHAGCDVKDIVAAIGLKESDLFHDKPITEIKPKVVARYDYTDAEGNLLYQVVRRSDKSFMQRRPNGPGRWVWNMKGTARVLYNLPYVASTPIQDWVFVVEGEKDVDALRALNIAATTNSGGAGKWNQVDDDSVLHGRQVAIIPDNDDAGREHAQQVALALHGKAKVVKIVTLPRMPEKGDVSDWLGRFKKTDYATPYIRIRRYACKAKEFVPAGQSLCKAEPENPLTFGPILTCLADVQPCEVEWLWPRRIAIGKITMLAGDPGLGKSFCSMDIAARISAGIAWPDLPDAPQPSGDVIILSAEDALDDTIRPRLDAADADPSRVCALEAIREIDPNTRKPRQRGFHLDKDIENLEYALKQRPGCRLVVIDPISSYMGDANSHNNAEVRGLLAPLSDLATRHRVAVLCISHLNKGAGDAMYRVMGSLAFVAAARAGYAVVKDHHDDSGQRRLILPIKNNLGDDESGLAYRIMETPGTDQPHVEWEPEMVYTTVNEALGIDKPKGEFSESTENNHRRKTQVSEAVDWLDSFLIDGEQPAREVIDAAKSDGISQRTLERAKVQAGVMARREGFADGGRWMWRKIEIDALVEQAKAATME